MLQDRWRDRIGLAFFVFATAVSMLATIEHPSLLAALSTAHNGLLAYLYTRRKAAKNYNRKTLWMGLIVALAPIAWYPDRLPFVLGMVGVIGYGLIFWSLLSLGGRFGIAAADRGLVKTGPYRWIRHPMYVGEVLLRGAMLVVTPWPGLLLLAAMVVVQGVRAVYEERAIEEYTAYAAQTRWRFVPYLW